MTFTSRACAAAFLVTTITVPLSACTSEPEAPPSNPAEVRDKAEFARRYCVSLSSCCEQAGQTPSCSLESVVVPTAHYDAAKGTACLEELERAKATPDLCALRAAAIPSCSAALLDAPARFGAEGEGPCFATLDDYGALKGKLDGDASGIVCEATRGLFCDPTSKKCARRRSAGSSCTDERNVACEETSRCVDGVCRSRKRMGDACAATEPDDCPIDAFCDEEKKACTPLRAAGQPCSSNIACVSRFCGFPANVCEPGGRGGASGGRGVMFCAPR